MDEGVRSLLQCGDKVRHLSPPNLNVRFVYSRNTFPVRIIMPSIDIVVT